MTHIDEKIKQIINENSGKGEIRVKCVNCGHEKVAKDLSINTESGVYNCYRCDIKGNAFKKGYSEKSEKSDPVARARYMIDNSYPVNPDFPYLVKKQIKAYPGVWQYTDKGDNEMLLIPVLNSNNETISIQRIYKNGDKRFLEGTKKKGNFFKIKGNKLIFICEGYATACSIHEATGATVYIAFDASNLPYVLDKIAKNHDEIVICADNDHKIEGNPGLSKAISAALKYDNVKVVYPVDIIGTDFNDMAIEKGLQAVKERIAQAKRPDKKDMPKEFKEPEKYFNHTDLGNGERFIDRHGDKIRYSFEAGKWLVWNGKNWEFSNKGEINQYAKDTIRNIPKWNTKQVSKEKQGLETELQKLQEDKDPDEPTQILINELSEKIKALEKELSFEETRIKFSRKSEENARVNAMISLGKHEPGVTVDLEDFDSDKWLFNCQNGTIDLQTGKLKPHNRLDMNMKISSVNFDPAAACPLWDKFLDDIFNGDQDLIDFMQRSVGYALTGDISQEVFWVLYGKGGNGKGTFINTVMSIFSDYGKTASFPLLCTPSSKQNDNALNQLALLKGARFVSASEGEENAVMNESNIKTAVSPDSGRVMARFKYQDLFDYAPEFKIFLATNYKPTIKGTDDGIWRRVMLIPFDKTFKGENRDDDLKTKLQAELPGIFNWMIQGCMEYQKQGLNPPAAVLNATEQYKKDMDKVSNFLDECCVVNPDEKVTVAELYKKYKEYCLESGIKPLGKQKFNKKIEEKKYKQVKGHANKMFWFGLSIISDSESDPEPEPPNETPEPEKESAKVDPEPETKSGYKPEIPKKCLRCQHRNRVECTAWGDVACEDAIIAGCKGKLFKEFAN